MLISIHTFLAEGDLRWPIKGMHQIRFQSTPSSRKVTYKLMYKGQARIFQSTPSSRKVTYHVSFVLRHDTYFNPHLPRGRWLVKSSTPGVLVNFNPHLPRGRWPLPFLPPFLPGLFQSTPSSRKVTRIPGLTAPLLPFQSTPSSRKVTEHVDQPYRRRSISIHTFLAEGDTRKKSQQRLLQISIHTFLAEGDEIA